MSLGSVRTYDAAIRHIVEVLRSCTFSFGTEAVLHRGISQMLAVRGVEHQREYSAKMGPPSGRRDRFRFDFYCDGVVIEVKIKGSLSEALRQSERYCKHPEVQAVIIATTCLWAIPTEGKVATFHDKPVTVIALGGQAF